MQASRFPTRAILDSEGGYEDLAKELRSRGIEVVWRDFEDFLVRPQVTPSDLVVGNHLWTRTALKQLGIPVPTPPDYPDCLKHLLHRRIWTTTLGEALNHVRKAQGQTFVKPAVDAKTFSAVIEPRDQMLELFLTGVQGTTMKPHAPETPVFCAEVVNIVTEYRVYVVNGEIRACCHYGGGPQDLWIDLAVVEEAVRVLGEHEPDVIAGCGMDFGVLQRTEEGEQKHVTCLVEVNDGYSLGVYDGFGMKDYADMLVARWEKLLTHLPAHG
jgi:hypothetical protein